MKFRPQKSVAEAAKAATAFFAIQELLFHPTIVEPSLSKIIDLYLQDNSDKMNPFGMVFHVRSKHLIFSENPY